MERIGIRELRQHASRYVAQVRAGATVEVTDRGTLVALLVPPEPGRGAREQLIADGVLEPAASGFRLPTRVNASVDSAEVLAALRDDR